MHGDLITPKSDALAKDERSDDLFGKCRNQEQKRGSPDGSVVKSLPANAEDTRSIPDPGGFAYTTEQLNPWPQPLSLCCRAWELHPLKPTRSGACAFYGESQGALVVKNSRTNAGDIKDAGSISGSVRSPRAGNGSPLQYSCLENPVDRGVWWVQSMGSQRVGHD